MSPIPSDGGRIRAHTWEVGRCAMYQLTGRGSQMALEDDHPDCARLLADFFENHHHPHP